MGNKDLFNMAVATIFARECMEAMIIIGEFRTAILRSENKCDETTQKKLLRAVTTSALAAAFVAILVVTIVAIPLAVLSKGINGHIGSTIEGVSKMVATICVTQLSLKMPKWLGFYKSTKGGKVQTGLDLNLTTIRFNVAWNIWRETAECGMFLLPSFLTGHHLGSIPLSAVIGIFVGCLAGFGIYMANQKMKNKFYLCILSTLVAVFLATGLLVGGAHEFEEVSEESRVVWEVRHKFWYDNRLPMVIIKPFGYTSERTLAEICLFWGWLAVCGALHYFKIRQTKKIDADLASGKLVYDETAKGADIEKSESQVLSSADDENDAIEKALDDDDIDEERASP
ncbi:hypothetical protein MPSEU_000748600 [Mayamaea pseudoterrestris]|nr:hypothetical protein MPSEU_000748600 [Mayamaea pseudoterrestris]